MRMKIEELDGLEKESQKIPIIGKEKGAWLLSKVQEKKPERVLELGTANGYSGVILGSEGAELITIEKDSHIAEEATANFKKFGTDAFVIIGDGVAIVSDLVKKQQKFDMIFIDFALRQYIDVLENCIALLNSNGVLIADNINLEIGKRNCRDFKEKVMNDTRLKTEIIEIGDGMSYSIYLGA